MEKQMKSIEEMNLIILLLIVAGILIATVSYINTDEQKRAETIERQIK